MLMQVPPAKSHKADSVSKSIIGDRQRRDVTKLYSPAAHKSEDQAEQMSIAV